MQTKGATVIQGTVIPTFQDFLKEMLASLSFFYCL